MCIYISYCIIVYVVCFLVCSNAGKCFWFDESITHTMDFTTRMGMGDGTQRVSVFFDAVSPLVHSQSAATGNKNAVME